MITFEQGDGCTYIKYYKKMSIAELSKKQNQSNF